MARANVLSGQVHGKLDWVNMGEREVGMYLKTSDRDSCRCVLRGPEVESMLANGLLQKGMMITAYGGLSARCMRRMDDNSWMNEVLVDAARIVAEPAHETRSRGSIYANLKGVVNYWDENTLQLKTFLNVGEHGIKEKATLSLHMKNWIGGMTQDGQANFKKQVARGREYTTSALVEASSYRSREGEQVALLMLLPVDFRLQG